jgi:hypothetical protein
MGVPAKANTIPPMHVADQIVGEQLIGTCDAPKKASRVFAMPLSALASDGNSTRILPKDKRLSAQIRHSQIAAP